MGASGANTVISLGTVTNPESWKHQRSLHCQLCKLSGIALVLFQGGNMLRPGPSTARLCRWQTLETNLENKGWLAMRIHPSPDLIPSSPFCCRGKSASGEVWFGSLWETGGEILRDIAADAAAPCVSVTNGHPDVGTAGDRPGTPWWELHI